MPNIRRMGYILTLIIGAALATSMVWKPAPPAQFVGIKSADVPREMAGYSAPEDDILPPDVRAALASTDPLSRNYHQANGDVNFLLIGGTDRSALHDPRSCLIGAGMQLEDDHVELLPGTQIEARTCRAVSLNAVPGVSSQGGYDILYFYIVNGKVINQVTQIRAAMLLSAVLGQRGTPVYFLRFTRTISPNTQQYASDHAGLQQFAAEMWKHLKPRLIASSG
jgi:hypothetical protein